MFEVGNKHIVIMCFASLCCSFAAIYISYSTDISTAIFASQNIIRTQKCELGPVLYSHTDIWTGVYSQVCYINK